MPNPKISARSAGNSVTGASRARFGKQLEPAAGDHQPDCAGNHRGREGGGREPHGTGRPERRAARHVPRRQAEERVDQRQRNGDHERSRPAKPARAGEQRRQQHAHDRPDAEVQREAAAARQDRMHQAGVSS